jgi:hypothetical protein
VELIDAVKELQMQEAETANEWLSPEYQHILTHADALRAEVKRRYDLAWTYVLLGGTQLKKHHTQDQVRERATEVYKRGADVGAI